MRKCFFLHFMSVLLKTWATVIMNLEFFNNVLSKEYRNQDYTTKVRHNIISNESDGMNRRTLVQ